MTKGKNGKDNLWIPLEGMSGGQFSGISWPPRLWKPRGLWIKTPRDRWAKLPVKRRERVFRFQRVASIGNPWVPSLGPGENGNPSASNDLPNMAPCTMKSLTAT